MLPLLTGVAVMTALMTSLALVVVISRRLLIPEASAQVTVNKENVLRVQYGTRLLDALADQNIYLPSACGGRGTCGQCRVQITEGAGHPHLPESALIDPDDVEAGFRLACLTPIRQSMGIRLDSKLLTAKRRVAKVVAARQVTTFMRELVLEIVDGEDLDFRAGDYVLVEAPAGLSKFADFAIDSKHQSTWTQLGLMKLAVNRPSPEVRAYSLADAPTAKNLLTLVVRIALPPPSARRGTPPGMVSSYLFGVPVGGKLSITGPFGDFHVRQGSREIVLIGGGAGIAPLRAIVKDQLLNARTSRHLSLWYGVRTVDDLCYARELANLAQEHSNFTWHVALSEAAADKPADMSSGFVHDVVYDQYLREHPAPDGIDFMLCGPPLMTAAVTTMLEDIGVRSGDILFDNFGSQT